MIQLAEPESFKDWCDEHLYRYYKGKLKPDFEATCKASKKRLLDIFGSSYKKFIVIVREKDRDLVNENMTQLILDRLNGYCFDILDVPKKLLTQKYFSHGRYKKIKTTKYLSTFFKNHGLESEGTIRHVNIIGRLINEQNGSSMKPDQYSVHILFGPHSYLQLGHYGPDTGISCYARDRGYVESKITISQTVNREFILLIKHNDKIVIRCRAYINDTNTCKVLYTFRRFYGIESDEGAFDRLTTQIIIMKFISKVSGKKIDQLIIDKHYNTISISFRPSSP